MPYYLYEYYKGTGEKSILLRRINKTKVLAICPYGDGSFIECWKQNILEQDPETQPIVKWMGPLVICVRLTE